MAVPVTSSAAREGEASSWPSATLMRPFSVTTARWISPIRGRSKTSSWPGLISPALTKSRRRTRRPLIRTFLRRDTSSDDAIQQSPIRIVARERSQGRRRCLRTDPTMMRNGSAARPHHEAAEDRGGRSARCRARRTGLTTRAGQTTLRLGRELVKRPGSESPWTTVERFAGATFGPRNQPGGDPQTPRCGGRARGVAHAPRRWSRFFV